MAKRCGVEITGEELRYVVMEGPERRPRLVRYGRVPLGEGRTLTEGLAHMRGESGPGQAPLRIALGTQSSILRVLSLPAMPWADLEKVVSGEAGKERKILGEELSYGYRVLPAARGEKRRTVLLALSAGGGIEDVEDAAAEGGRLPESITTSSLAVLAIAAGIARAAGANEPSALLHLGLDRMILTITEGEGLRQFRDLGLGMNASLLQERAATGTDGPAPMDWDMLDQIGQGLDEVTQVAQQVRQTLSVDASQNADRPVTRLMLAGDVTRAGAMAPILENELGLPVAVLDPLENLDIPGNDELLRPQAASFVLPIALARGERPDRILHLGRRPERPAAKGSIALAAVLLSAALAMSWAQGHFQERAAWRKEELNAVSAGAAGQSLSEAEAQRAAERREWVRTVRTGAAYPLLWLSGTLPEGMRLVEVDIQREQDSWRIDFTAQISQPEKLASYAGPVGPDRRADAALLAWPALRAAWAGDPAVVDIAIAPPLGIMARTQAPEDVSGTLQLRGEP